MFNLYNYIVGIYSSHLVLVSFATEKQIRQ